MKEKASYQIVPKILTLKALIQEKESEELKTLVN